MHSDLQLALLRAVFPGRCVRDNHHLFNDVSPNANARSFYILTPNSAVYVQGRNAFEGSGHTSHLGAKAFGFMWAAVTCMFLSILFFGLAGGLGTKSNAGYNGRKQRRRGFFASKRSGSVRSQKEQA